MSTCISRHGEYDEHQGTGEFCECCGECNHAQIRREAKAEALREAADDFNHSTTADIHNAIGRPAPTYATSDWLAAVLWLENRADQIEGDRDE